MPKRRRPSPGWASTTSACWSATAAFRDQALSTPVILAGGLGPDNVAEAIRAVRPAGVDSKTMTDRGETHTKDLEKMRLFHLAVRASES